VTEHLYSTFEGIYSEVISVLAYLMLNVIMSVSVNRTKHSKAEGVTSGEHSCGTYQWISADRWHGFSESL